MTEGAILIELVIFEEALITKDLVAGRTQFRFNNGVITHVAGDG